MSTLAIFGGPQTITRSFARYNSIGREEAEAAKAVVESGLLSGFLGSWDPAFYGGPQVQKLERSWARHFGVRHAIAVNSATSGLIAAMGALGVEPGAEVIVSPWTMSASATAILVWNAIPVFVDIEDETFNLNPVCLERAITPYTQAIMVTDIFGHSADMDPIMEIARRHKLKVVEDCAQAPGALYKGRYAGTTADIGVYSLNYHKHVHTGEGGVCVTDDPVQAERIQLIRNHGESVVDGKGVTDLTNMIGFNFRMTEIEAAIGTEQLKKLERLVADRTAVAERFGRGLEGLKGLRLPVVKPDCTHVYYAYPMLVDEEETGVPRAKLVEALRAEGVRVSEGYENVHLLPMYQKRMAYGSSGFPWSCDIYKGRVTYEKGICPVAEDLHDRRCMKIAVCLYHYEETDAHLVTEAFRKVWDNLGALKAASSNPSGHHR